ncbi:hypothetical protein [Rhizobium leguminosarum]|uniref:hypothetical protein n=1 Tax=Rhizobium leguminosarum TaxID=384 RepID=UPI0013F17DCF|nr:hypothetical protein [Rhizobium leguminosarum]
MAGAEEAEGPEADTKGEEQAAAPTSPPIPVEQNKERRPVSKIVSITCGLRSGHQVANDAKTRSGATGNEGNKGFC